MFNVILKIAQNHRNRTRIDLSQTIHDNTYNAVPGTPSWRRTNAIIAADEVLHYNWVISKPRWYARRYRSDDR